MQHSPNGHCWFWLHGIDVARDLASSNPELAHRVLFDIAEDITSNKPLRVTTETFAVGEALREAYFYIHPLSTDSAVTTPASAAAIIPAEPSANPAVIAPAHAAAAIPAVPSTAPAVTAPAPAVTTPAPTLDLATPSSASAHLAMATSSIASAIFTESSSSPAVITPAYAWATPMVSTPGPAAVLAVPAQAKSLQPQPLIVGSHIYPPMRDVPPFPSLMQGGGHDLPALRPVIIGQSLPVGEQPAPSVPAPLTSAPAAGFHPHEPVLPSRESFIFDPGGYSGFSWLY